jgi:hypothetical protein
MLVKFQLFNKGIIFLIAIILDSYIIYTYIFNCVIISNECVSDYTEPIKVARALKLKKSNLHSIDHLLFLFESNTVCVFI